MGFKIGAVETIGDPASWKADPKDRVTVTQCINGTYVEDNGLNEADTVYSCTITVTQAGYDALKGYRASAAKVDITDHRGVTLAGKTFKITEIAAEEGSPYWKIGIEYYSA